MLPSKLAFVDIETTGMSTVYDRIIEIAIIRMEEGVVVDRFETLVNPQRPISPFISNLTTIFPHELEHSPTWSEVAETIKNLLEGYVFTAHNVRFDYGFVKEQFRHVGIDYNARQLCTVRLSRALYPQYKGHGLDRIIERHGMVCTNRHRAMGDTQVICDFYLKMLDEHPEQVLEAAIDPLLKRPSLPPRLAPNLVDTLPDEPGVYIFYGENHTPLYVGKSVHVRTRVLSHFAKNHTESREMSLSQQIIDIETRTTTGELGALLLEQHLIKTLQPLHNRMLRNTHRLIVARTQIDAQGYMCVTAEPVEQIDPHSLDSIIGIYKNRRQMTDALRALAQEHGLCEIKLGIEKGTTCFGYKLNRCRGACAALEAAPLYNARFQMAVAGKWVKKWPFNEAVVLTEEDTDRARAEGYVIDKWCLVGKVVQEDQDLRWEYVNEYIFDLDVYKILSRHLTKNARSVRTLSSLNVTLPASPASSASSPT